MTEQIALQSAENTESAAVSALTEASADKNHSVLSTPSSLAGKYQFIKKLGQGSQAKVYLARRLRDDQLVAIKQIDIESVSNWKEYDLFQREVNVLSSLDINGVALFYEAVECLDDSPPRSYLVQEYIAGESLGAMLKAGHRFSTDEVYDILIQLLTILYQLQNRPNPIIHRDIKPSNIMLSPVNGGYYVTLIDFGAVANPQVQSGGSTTAGTFGYMPPEQLMCKPQPASDIYALGAVAVELFTGKSPADLPSKDFYLIFEPEMQSQPPALVSTLRKMLEPDCSKRLSDCLQLIKTFKHYKCGEFNKSDEFTQSGVLTPIDNKYNKELQEVAAFGAPGNIDLWQILDDKTPREIPQAYAQINWSEQINLPNSSNLGTDKQQNQEISIFAAVLVLAIFAAAPILMIVYGMNSLVSMLAVSAAAFILSGIVLGIAFRISSRIANSDSRRFARIVNSSKKQNIVTPMPKTVSDLLKYGRKTIATIVSINYVPVADTMVVKGALVTGDRPGFRISYKFNPPDDFKSEDLIHECIVYNEPENTYRVGDPFPILYCLDGQNFDEVVTSMPFPYPLGCISESSVVYSSTPGEEFWSYLKTLAGYERYEFITCRNDLPRLAKEIDIIKSSDWLSKTEYQYAVLPILNCYLKAEPYSPVHANCLNCFSDCLNKGWFIGQINSFIMNYLCKMKIQSEEIYTVLIRNIVGNPNTSPDVVSKIVDMVDDDSVAYRAFMSSFSPKLASIILKRGSLKYIHAEVLNSLCVYLQNCSSPKPGEISILCDYLNKRPVDVKIITPTVINSVGWCTKSLQMSGNALKMVLRALVGIYFDTTNAALRLAVREQVRSMCAVDKRFEYYLNALGNPKLADDFKNG